MVSLRQEQNSIMNFKLRARILSRVREAFQKKMTNLGFWLNLGGEEGVQVPNLSYQVSFFAINWSK